LHETKFDALLGLDFAVFSETHYALNGDLRVAYRASREGPRGIVWVPNWHSCCEVVPELPSIQGWVEAMTSLGRLIVFDQPGTGASDPVETGALPTLEQWADSITAVLDDLGSTEAVLLAWAAAFAPAALFAATHPTRTTALVVLDGYADPRGTRLVQDEIQGSIAMWGSGKLQHLLNPDMPRNEEIRASWARLERLAGQPKDASSDEASCGRTGRAGGPSDRPCADSCRPALRQPVRPTREGQVHRRAHTRREIC
jgi:pimeloyl-ACP methyl ester carboxylesterase